MVSTLPSFPSTLFSLLILIQRAKMLKRQVLRQARACRALRPSSLPLSILTPGATSRLSAACKPAVLTASLRSQFIARGYASASAEAASPSGASSSGLITRFGDLSSIGVHENILRAITQDMGYVDMTDVQAMSINPALQGKDMYVSPALGWSCPAYRKLTTFPQCRPSQDRYWQDPWIPPPDHPENHRGRAEARIPQPGQDQA